MSDLLRLVNLGALALRANNSGIAIAARNTANVNTEGYSRQDVELKSGVATNFVGGVFASGPNRPDTELIALRERTARGESGLNASMASALQGLEDTFTRTGNDITAALAEMFGAISEVSANPTDVNLRQQVIDRGRVVADAFSSLSTSITSDIDESDERVRTLAGQASDLASEIASLNRQLTVDDDPVLLDQRELAATKLTELVGGTARVDGDGKMRFVLDGGTVMVDGNNAAELRASVDVANDGKYRLDVVDGNLTRNVTNDLGGGKLAGEIQFRDVVGEQTLDDLDELAFQLVSNMNAVHRANDGTDGGTGRDFFTDLASADGAAAALEMDAALLADPALLATASPGAGPANNGGAQALVGLRDQPITGTNRSFTDQSIDLISQIGRLSSSASQRQEFDESKLEQLASLRDSVAGVSVEDEMIRLTELQNASEAAVRFLTTVDEMLTSLIRNL